MRDCNLVFVIGHSGLSINHSFCYGRPYATIKSNSQPPEIDYIENGQKWVHFVGEL